MNGRILSALLHLVLRRSRLLLVGAAVLTVVSAALVPGLRIAAGHRGLSAPDSPQFVRLEAFLEEFGSPNQLVAMVQGGNEALRRELVDRMQAELPAPAPPAGAAAPGPCRADAPAGDPGCIRDVVGHVDLERLSRHALLFLPEDKVRSVVKALSRDTMGATALGRVDGVASLLRQVAGGIDAAIEGEAAAGDDAGRAGQAMQALADALDEITRRLTDPSRLDVPLEEALLPKGSGADRARRGLDAEGYFSSQDGSIKLAMLRPVHETDKPREVLALVQHVERQTTRLAEEVGAPCRAAGACPEGRLHVAFTGLPALVADEARTLNDDLALTSLIAFLGIAALFALGFRSVRSAIIGVPPIVLSLVWTLAFVRVTFGTLNLVTVSFVATMLGLGINFVVHLLARYQEALREGLGREASVEAAIMGAGPGLLTGGLTTAGAFLALAPTSFKAFSELGIMSGVGVTLSLLATLTLVPAALLLPRLGWLQAGLDRPERTGLLTETLPAVVVRRPLVFVGAGLVAAIWLGLQGQSIGWNYDYTELMPDDVPSVKAWKTLRDSTDHSPEVAALIATSEEEARRLVRALEASPVVSRVQSLTTFLPSDQGPKLAELAKLRPRVEGLAPTPATADPTDAATLLAAAQQLRDSLEDAQFEARRGHAEEASLLDPPIAAVARLQEAVKGLPEAQAPARIAAVQAQLLDLRRRAVETLQVSTDGKPVTVATLLEELPPGLSRRLYRDGRFAIYAYPAQDIGLEEHREAFVQALYAVSPTATGFPVTHYESTRQIEAGFRQASVLAVLAVVLLLFLDFRSVVRTVVALLPLIMGIIWAWGGMSLLGMSYNPANIIGFPLVVGIGVDTGVHVLHRFIQEGRRDAAAVIRHTGRAIFLATATTLIGFGSLILASHRGVSSLGVVLVLGVGACLLTSTLVLPAGLELVARRVRRTEPPW